MTTQHPISVWTLDGMRSSAFHFINNPGQYVTNKLFKLPYWIIELSTLHILNECTVAFLDTKIKLLILVNLLLIINNHSELQLNLIKSGWVSIINST